MSETKHTPGPWRHARTPHKYNDGSTQTFGPDGVFSADGEESICQVYGIYSNTRLEEIKNDPRVQKGIANARLIAAAPELLAALEAVQGTIWADCRIPLDVRKDWDAVYHNVIMPAIRKARGEE